MFELKQIIPEKIHDVDRRTYGRYVANWTYLSSFLASGVTLTELGILLSLEINGKARDFIISRLLGRITTFYRLTLQDECAAMVTRIKEEKAKK